MIIIAIILAVVIVFGISAFTGAPYVPTHPSQLNVLFTELYPLKKTDVVIDIGSGDGIVLREVARRGGRAIGYEINPILVVISWLRLYRYRGRVSIRLANFWRAQFPVETTVIYTFGESRDIIRMYEKVQSEATRLKKPLYFISYGFTLKNNITPIKTVNAHHLYEITPLQFK